MASRLQMPSDDSVLLSVTHSNLKNFASDVRFSLQMTVESIKEKLWKKCGTSVDSMLLELYDDTGAKVCDLNDNLRLLGFFSPQDGYRLHIIDLDPASVTSGGWLEDTSLVEKYTISEEAYNNLDGTYRKFKEKLVSQNPSLLENKITDNYTPSGGHLSHGYYTPSGKKVSGASIFFESFPYKVNPVTGYIDYDKLEERALDYRPKILICGGSSYPREWDYARFRQIADKCGAVLMCDMAHISGLVAAKECLSPFDYCDIVTSTTHKSLRGPRGGIIFYRKGKRLRKRMSLCQGEENDHFDFEDRINFAVFPSLQGGPHNNHIAALAIALKQVATPEYKAYMQQVKKNAQTLASALLRRKCRLVTGGTDNHLLLWDLRTLGLTGKNFEKVCEICQITLNKSAIFGDNGAISPGGVRIGTPAMTSRGCLEGDFETIADFLLRAAQIASIVQKEHGKLQKDFLKGLQNNKDIVELRNRVENFASQFAMPALDC